MLGSTAEKSEKCGMDHILDAQNKGEISEDNVLYTVENISVGAIETTLCGSIEWGVVELVNNPKIQKKIYAELDTILGWKNLITESDTCNNKLPYLTAFVK